MYHKTYLWIYLEIHALKSPDVFLRKLAQLRHPLDTFRQMLSNAVRPSVLYKHALRRSDPRLMLLSMAQFSTLVWTRQTAARDGQNTPQHLQTRARKDAEKPAHRMRRTLGNLQKRRWPENQPVWNVSTMMGLVRTRTARQVNANADSNGRSENARTNVTRAPAKCEYRSLHGMWCWSDA